MDALRPISNREDPALQSRRATLAELPAVSFASEPPAKLVYILAASHSGSTLLAMLLAAHPSVSTVGELKLGQLGDAERYLCSCREKLTQCGFWAQLSVEMKRRGYEFDATRAATGLGSNATPYVARLLRPLHRGRFMETVRDALLVCSPSWRRSLPIFQGRNAALIRSILTVANASAVVDSSKTGLRLKYLLRNPALDVRVVRLIRDGRGVALTYMDPGGFADATDPSLRGGGTGRSNNGRFVMPMERAARLWRRSNEEADETIKSLPHERVTTVRYEEVCGDTDAVLARLFRFIGVDAAERVREFRGVQRHVVGNGMRLDDSSAVVLDERWRSALHEEDLAAFERTAGALNRAYGYV
jgi:hypothetical protein